MALLSISSTYNTILKPSSTPLKTLTKCPSLCCTTTTTTTTPFSMIVICAAAKQQSGPSVKPNNKKRKKKAPPVVSKDLALQSLDLFDENDVVDRESVSGDGMGKGKGKGKRNGNGNGNGNGNDVYVPLPLPKPPAGFIVDDQGRVLMVAPKRLATIVDPTNNLPLECLVRRVFTNSKGEDCMLLCPVDTPVQILKSTNIEGWSAISDDEVEAVLPTAAYALAKIHMHLVLSGYCYTARGGFCYSEESIFEFRSDDEENVDGVPTEGVEITCFHLDGSHYMIYTPSDPLLFVATKDENGQLRIADDDLLEDPAVVGAIDEETEFNALVEEEAALLESMFGER